jgi:integrase
LAPRKKCYFASLGVGTSLGYRRTVTGAGSWSVRVADGKGGNWLKALGLADDLDDGAGMDFRAACTAARELAGVEVTAETTRPCSVAEAIDAYQTSLAARGADIGNATRVRSNLPARLAACPVAMLKPKELRTWRDGLVKAGMTPSGADRTAKGLRAALAQAAGDDERIANTQAWRVGLKRLPEGDLARNVVLSDSQVLAVIKAAHTLDRGYGLLCELAAVTGARRSQLVRLVVEDLQDVGTTPRVMMPSSRKGRNRKPTRTPVPISTELAKKLRAAAVGRPSSAPLLVQTNGKRWPAKNDLMFRQVAAAAGLDASVTAYALRHSAITRMLLAGVPIRLAAVLCDTSTTQIEKNYSASIGDHSDALARRAMLDAAAPAGNVVALTGRKA